MLKTKCTILYFFESLFFADDLIQQSIYSLKLFINQHIFIIVFDLMISIAVSFQVGSGASDLL